MATKAQIVANYWGFVRNGASVDAVTVSSSVKPDDNPTTNWTPLGKFEQLQVSNQESSEEIIVPAGLDSSSPGSYVPDDEITKMVSMIIEGRTATLGITSVSLIWGTEGDVTPGTAAVPMAKLRARGWSQIQQYDQDDTLINTAYFWGDLMISGAAVFGNAIVKPTIRLKVLNNALNSVLIPSSVY